MVSKRNLGKVRRIERALAALGPSTVTAIHDWIKRGYHWEVSKSQISNLLIKRPQFVMWTPILVKRDIQNGAEWYPRWNLR